MGKAVAGWSQPCRASVDIRVVEAASPRPVSYRLLRRTIAMITSRPWPRTHSAASPLQVDRRMSAVSQSISRSTIGLTIELCSSVIRKPDHAAPPSFVDETFRCASSDVDRLLEYLKVRRGDVVSRLEFEERVSVFIPQGDPPIIRVTRGESRTAYFTLGELVRWRFIRHFPSYPLKVHQEEGGGLAPRPSERNPC